MPFSYVIAQLPFLVPQAAIFVVGIVVSLGYLKRAARPAMFALTGSSLLLATLVVTTLSTAVMAAGPGRNLPLLAIVNGFGTLARAAGLALLLAAVFVERGSDAPATLTERLGRVCASCGERGPIAAKFCMQCGAAQ